MILPRRMLIQFSKFFNVRSLTLELNIFDTHLNDTYTFLFESHLQV